MNEIDDRVVRMQFENSKFESGVQKSLGTLDKLKSALRFTDAKDGFSEIEKQASKGLSLGAIGDAVENISSKFSAFGVIAMTTLQNLTNSAINTGTRLVKSLSVDQITQGFSKYESKTQSVQTIMNATGKSIDEVGDSLDRLNWFTDETSYNFTDMVSNVGKFTSQQIDLDKAVDAMQGIATWAGLSGANIGEASRAMYNLSQAMGVGSVKLIDWKSIENANMATADFKRVALETAAALGTLTKAGDDLYRTNKGTTVSIKDFNSALTEGWFTSDVLMQTLSKYGGFATKLQGATEKLGSTASETLRYIDKYKEGTLNLSAVARETGVSTSELKEILEELGSEEYDLGRKAFKAAQEAKTFSEAIAATKDAVSTGWMNTFEHIFGNYEEAKELWTDLANELYDIFAESGNKRNELLAIWHDVGGRDDLLEGFWNVFHAITDIIAVIKDAWHDIFPETTVHDLLTISYQFKLFTERLRLSDEASDKLRKTFDGLFSVVKIGWTVLKGLYTVIKPVFSLFSEIGSYIFGATGAFGGFLTALKDSVETTTIFSDLAERVASGVAWLSEKIKGAVDWIRELFGVTKDTADAAEKALSIPRQYKDAFEGMLKPLKKVSDLPRGYKNAFEDLDESIGKPTSHIIETFDKIKDRIVNSPFLDFAKSLLGVIKKLGGVVVSLLSGGLKAVPGIIDGIGGAFSKLGDAIKGSGILDGLKSFWDLIKKIGSGALDFITESLTNFGNKIKSGDFSGIFDILGGIFSVFSAKNAAEFTGSLAGGGKKISGFLDNLKDIGGDIKGILEGVRETLEAYQKSLKAKTLLKIAAAVAILAASLVLLASIDPVKMTIALGAITGLFAELLGSMAIFNKISSGKNNNITKTAVSLLMVSGAVLILSLAMKALASLDPASLVAGLATITVLLGELVIVSKTIESNNAPKGLIGLAAAVLVLAAAMRVMAKLSWEDTAKGLVAISALLLALGLFTHFTEGSKNMTSIGVGMIAIAASMLIFAGAIKILGSMDYETLLKGLGAMVGTLAALTIALNLMPDDIVKKAISLNLLAVAMLLLGAAFKIFSSGTWESLAKGLVGLIAVLAALTIVVKVLDGSLAGAASLLIAAFAITQLAIAFAAFSMLSWEGIAKALVGIAGAFAVIGIAAAVLTPVAPVILALAAAMLMLSIAIVAGAVGMAMMAGAVLAFAKAFEIAGPAVVNGITSVLQGLISLIPSLASSLAQGIVEFSKVIIDGAGDIAEALISVVVSVAKEISEHALEIADAILDLLVGILQKIAENMPKIVQYLSKILSELVKLVLTFLEDLLSQLAEFIPKVVDLTMQLIAGILEAIATNIPDIAQKGTDIVIAFLDAIGTEVPRMIDAGWQMVISLIDGIADSIDNNKQDLFDAMEHLFDSTVDFIVEFLRTTPTKLYEAGKRIIKDGFLAGIKDLLKDVWPNFDETLNNAKTKIGDFFQKFVDAGANLINGLVQGIKNGAQSVINAVTGIASDAWNGFKNFLGIKSPSRKFRYAGEMSVLGYIKGLESTGNEASKSAKEVGDDIARTFTEAITAASTLAISDMDMSPVITPVVDLSQARKGISTLKSMTQSASSISEMLQPAGGQNEVDSSGKSIVYNQYNYSPKALSRIDIYRQTKAQLAGIKGR